MMKTWNYSGFVRGWRQSASRWVARHSTMAFTAADDVSLPFTLPWKDDLPSERKRTKGYSRARRTTRGKDLIGDPRQKSQQSRTFTWKASRTCSFIVSQRRLGLAVSWAKPIRLFATYLRCLGFDLMNFRVYRVKYLNSASSMRSEGKFSFVCSWKWLKTDKFWLRATESTLGIIAQV